MATLLRIDASSRGDYSVSKTLGKQFTAEWEKNNVGGKVITHDTTQEKLPFVDLPWIGGAYTPVEKQSEQQQAAIKVSDDLVDELLAADELLITTPMYNFSIPASLKAWIDHVVRLNRTFTPDYKGLVKTKKAWIIMASGGEYGPGAYAEGYNMATTYLKQILGFIGITDVEIILAGNTSGIDQGTTTLPEYVSKHADEVVSAAK